MAYHAIKPAPDFPQDTPMAKHVELAALVFPSVTVVFFGIGIVTVLLYKPLIAHPLASIPAVMVGAVVLGAVAAWIIAPRMRARFGPARRPPPGKTPRG